jgi:hypothetical protein
VWCNDDVQHGHGSMFIKAAAGDLRAFEDAVEMLSRAQKILGDTRTPGQRRASAVGIIANPQAAQDMIARAERVRKLQIEAAAARRAGDLELVQRIEQSVAELMLSDPTSAGDGASPDRGRCDRKSLQFGTSVLYYHLSQETLDAILTGEPFAGAGIVRLEDIGPVIADQVRQWLQHSNVVLKPVIDLAGTAPVDHYEVPQRMSEVIGLRRRADYFPHGTCLTRHQENDHTIAYVPMDEGGPPGQTDPATMAKITKHHHRIKTFAGWQVTLVAPGSWLWRSPHGYHFLVHPHGTTALGKP